MLGRIPPLFYDLAKIISGEIECAPEVLLQYANDGSPYSVLPQAIIYPKNATDIRHILAFARESKMPVTVRGKGEAKTGGALGEGIIIDMSRYFNHIRNISMIDNTITVDAGVTVNSLLEKLHSWNYDIPYLLSKYDTSTVGGLIAAKTASPSSFFHGSIREWIEGLSVVVDTGEEHKIQDGITPSGRLLGIYQAIFPFITKENALIRAAKPLSHDDGSGYNIWNNSIGPRQLIDQLVGSEGTLGIITSVTFRIRPLPKYVSTVCIPVKDTLQLPEIIAAAKDHNAEAMYVFDETFMQLAERYRPLTVPYFSQSPYALLVSHFHDDEEKLETQVETFMQSLPIDPKEIKKVEGREVLGQITDTSFMYSLLDLYTHEALLPVPITSGLHVPLYRIPSFMYDIEEYLSKLGKLYVITGNIGSGHVSIVTLFDPQTATYEEDLIEYAKNIFSIVKKYKGSISASYGEGLSKTPYLMYTYNDTTLNLFKKTKNAWDPLNILNPGKKGDIDIRYLRNHTKRSAK